MELDVSRVVLSVVIMGLAAAILLSYKGKSLLTVALGAVAVVFLAQRLLPA